MSEPSCGVLVMGRRERIYNPYSRAHRDQYYRRQCRGCEQRLEYWRESGHQQWRYGRPLEDIVEIDDAVYLKCECGALTPTRLKPMSAYEPKDWFKNRAHE